MSGQHGKNLKQRLKIDKSKVFIVNNWTASRELLKIGKNRIIHNTQLFTTLYVGWLEKQKGIMNYLSRS